jgi:hypothetical protein
MSTDQYSPRYGNQQSEQPRGRKRKVITVAAIAGTILGAAGVALAAILLTTNITGQASVSTVNTANDLDVTASAVNGSQLDCSDINVSSDNTTLTFNPKLTKPAGGSNASNVPVPGGTCTINLAVKNTGDTVIKLDQSSTVTAPAGWNITALTGNALGSIQPNATANATATLSATGAAVAGPVGGKLVYTDAA